MLTFQNRKAIHSYFQKQPFRGAPWKRGPKIWKLKVHYLNFDIFFDFCEGIASKFRFEY